MVPKLADARAWRRVAVVTVAVGVLLGSLVAVAGATNAATGGGCSGYVESNFHWSQAACIGWDGSAMTADNFVKFETGFNRDHIISCTLEGTLVALTYSSTHTYTFDCYSEAHLGGSWEFPGPGSDLLGPGRQSGDRYSWHACLRVYTGTRYDSCAGAHPASPAITI
jgi:hypothetical protein